jgi:hypothetical protein
MAGWNYIRTDREKRMTREYIGSRQTLFDRKSWFRDRLTDLACIAVLIVLALGVRGCFHNQDRRSEENVAIEDETEDLEEGENAPDDDPEPIDSSEEETPDDDVGTFDMNYADRPDIKNINFSSRPSYQDMRLLSSHHTAGCGPLRNEEGP